MTENEPQTEMSQSDPSYGKMNDKDVAKLTKTKSGEGDAGTKEGYILKEIPVVKLS